MKTKRKSSFLFLRIITSQSQSKSLCTFLVFLPASDNRELRLRLHVPPMSLFFVPFKNGFNAVLWCCLHITSKRSKVPLTKTVTLTVRENESLPVSPIFSFLCELLSVFVSLLRLVVFVLLALPEALPNKEFTNSVIVKISPLTILHRKRKNERNKPVFPPLLCVFFLLLLSSIAPSLQLSPP